MKQYITDNRTHYASEDINALVNAVVDMALTQRGWKFSRKGFDAFGVRYLKEIQPPDEDSPTWEQSYVGNYNPRLSKNLRILRKRDVDLLQPDLRLLAESTEEQVLLPEEVVAQIGAMGAYYVGVRKKRLRGRGYWVVRETLNELLPSVLDLVREKGFQVQVHDKVIDRPKKRKVTPEERAERLRKVYEEGRVSRKLKWRSDRELMSAVRSYDQAWRESLPQLERALAAGAHPVEHLNPADLLRFIADQWEKEGKV